MCCEAKSASSKTTAKAQKVANCVDASNGKIVRHACYASPFAPDACSFDATNSCAVLVVQETVNIPSGAQPANTPGTSGVTVTNPKLLTQFGGGLVQPEQRALHAPLPGGAPAAARRHPGPRARVRGRRGRLPHPGAEPDRARQAADGPRARGVGLRPADQPARGQRRARHRGGVPEPGDRARLALRRRARASARPAAGGGTESSGDLLRHAGRRPVHGELDEPRLLA